MPSTVTNSRAMPLPKKPAKETVGARHVDANVCRTKCTSWLHAVTLPSHGGVASCRADLLRNGRERRALGRLRANRYIDFVGGPWCA